ncbi:helix-turn-helix domain-containing protein [Microbacterium sp. LS_15]|uniref:TetR/AcrR family transcriptional regulator n=1 Tax=Microbacterium sp. LS_15 TaxID=3055790 RepID=UPI0035BFE03D
MTDETAGLPRPTLQPEAAPDLRRDPTAPLKVSRVAAALFWRDGLTAARGEDIAASAGISVRTLWRYFRSKEACVEPILESLAAPLLELLDAWPDEMSFEAYIRGVTRRGPVEFSADQVHGMQMVTLADTEPALRAIWLVICDAYEKRLRHIVARRLHEPADSADVVRITAAVAAANRALNDHLAEEYTRTGRSPEAETLAAALNACVTESSGGRLGPSTTTTTEDEK